MVSKSGNKIKLEQNTSKGKTSTSVNSTANDLQYLDTSQIKVPEKIADQIIGQEEGLKIMKKAALQRRHVLLIGEPGTGKSLIGQALAELLPATKLSDILCLPNDQDENNPLIRIMPKGKGKELVNKIKMKNADSFKNQNIIFFILVGIAIITPWWVRKQYGDILAAASLIGSMIFLGIFVIFMNLNRRMSTNKIKVPKLLVDSSEQKIAPFIDATGAHAGALLGDCLHDPLQSLDSSNTITFIEENNYSNNKQFSFQEKNISDVINKILKDKQNIIKNKEGYEATFIDKGEVSIVAEKENVIINSQVLSVNRYPKEGKLIKLTTETGKELIITPEHKVATKNLFNKID